MFRDILGLFYKFTVTMACSGVFWRWRWYGWDNLTVDDQDLFGKKLCELLVACGPFYQKVGQLLGSFDKKVVPEAIKDNLKQLQEENWVDIRPKEEIEEIMSTVPTKCQLLYPPIASGTVAQVHVGYLENGKKVAVKIVKKNIANKFEKNMSTINCLSGIIGKKSMAIKSIIKYLGLSIVKQTDLSYEHETINKFRYNNRHVLDRGFIHVPVTIGDSHPNVLIMEFIEAESCGNYNWDKLSDEKRCQIADNLSKIMIDSAINDAIYHIDLHPGNLMYNQELDHMYIIDFGLVSVCPRRTKNYQTELVACISEFEIDYLGLIKKYCEQNFVMDGTLYKNEEFIEDMTNYFDKFYIKGTLDFLQSAIYIRSVSEKFGLESRFNDTPNKIAMLCLNQTLFVIKPDYNLSRIIKKNRSVK